MTQPPDAVSLDAVLSAVVLVALAVLGGFGSVLWAKVSRTDDRVDKTATDLADYKVYVAREHPNNARLNEVMAALGDQFKQLFDRLGTIEREMHGFSNDFRDRLDSKQDRRHTDHS